MRFRRFGLRVPAARTIAAPQRRGGRFRLRAAVVAAAVLAAGLVTATPAAADDATIVVTGHGYGHGRGMGQYGAYGYAVSGSTYQQILAYYYGGTTLSSEPGTTLTVELTRVTGTDTIVTGPGLTVNGLSAGAAAVRARLLPDGTFGIDIAPGCAGPWTMGVAKLGSGLVIATTGDQSVLGNLPVVCEATKQTAYRGDLVVVNTNSKQYTFSRLSIDDYVRASVPREMPASWGDAAGGRGIEALKAQAVAARSYALAYGGRASGANVCDSTSCQVYGGAWEVPYASGVFKALEDSRTNAAVAATAGQVLRLGSGIARAEYSSSTGGYTAGGTFPVVLDAGDATANNPYQNWSKTISAASAGSALGLSSITKVVVTQRNGYGAEGGRVLSLVVTDSRGVTKTMTGDAFRIALGLNSNWFTVTASATNRAAAAAVVRSLYQDVLGREPDPAGLENWTNQILTSGAPGRVADGIVNSKERLAALIAAQYRGAVHREPESTGLWQWVGRMESGMTVSDLQIGVYASQESLQVLGNGDVGTWVAGMYAAVLGRPAGPSEIASWTNVAKTRGREAAVYGIVKSSEAGLMRLNDYYLRYLGRSIDAAGIASWLPAMSGRGDFTIPGMIGGSQEYWNRSQARYPS